jgi:uncharacterized protein YaaR (DUF327 family)
MDLVQLINIKRLAEQAKRDKKKAQAIDKKLQKLEDLGNNLSSTAIKNLMSDSNIIDRFTEYICNGLFKFSDPWIKAKYLKYR